VIRLATFRLNLFTRLGVADRAVKDLVNQPQRASRQLPSPIVHPHVQAIRSQFLELDR
jgi:hypothetical protein